MKIDFELPEPRCPQCGTTNMIQMGYAQKCTVCTWNNGRAPLEDSENSETALTKEIECGISGA